MRAQLLITALVLAGSALASDVERDIVRLIEEVKRADPDERYKIMNELKLRLRELNRREREEMIRKVYEELRGEREERHEYEERYEHHEEHEEEHEERYEERYEEKHYLKHEERGIEKGEDKSEYMEGDREHGKYHYYDDDDDD